MGNSLVTSILGKIGIAILVIALADLVYINYLVLENSKKELKSVSSATESRQVEAIASPTPVASASPDNLAKVQVILPTSTPTTIYKTQTVVQNSQKEFFVPIGSGMTYSNSYAALSGVEVTIDWSKYTGIQSVVFEATIWVDGGNGVAHAQLLDVDNNNAFNESTISSSSGSGEFKVSGNIPAGSGVKTYGIVAKTDLTEFAAHVGNAKIKITLR